MISLSNLTKNLLLGLGFCLFSASLFAQKAERIAGDLLLSLEPSASPERLASELSTDEMGRETGFFIEKKLQGPMNIWLAHFDESRMPALRMLDLARANSAVAVAQFNHKINDRSAKAAPDTIPNDPRFNQQWQYLNNGASGGTVDADIDAELAWDLARGGLTPDGDTIVVCVVDGGFNYNHPDFVGVAWKNWAEIPNNNIDDDQNGFVDDYHGWNTASQSDGITSNAGHGTPVCGIVGARGNDGVGVAGVNWNVKIMFVTYGSTQEDEVLEAYSYPFWFRKKWNETNGQAGAFVVSTNSSWGIDLGQPADSPLWCAFYDSLGREGIVSCGATANANYNIDTQGDLPTACPSDFLISVTNCGRTGKKVGQAGYGLETIDLGSFGESAYTVTTNSYGGFGGTSGATPHVTGAVALLYSAACGRLTKMAKNAPAEAALLAKKYLLETTDPESTLVGKTVTGGRLNIHQALLKMTNECTACFEPFAVAAEKVGVDSAVLTFSNLETGAATSLRWRKIGAADWAEVDSIASPFHFLNLEKCAEYEFELKNECADTASSWSATRLFKTDGCCFAPTGLAASNLTADGATVSWQGLTAAQNFVLEIREKGASTATETTVAASDNSLIINGLANCTEFEIRARTVCDTGATAWGDPVFFKTKGCGACTDFDYCPSKSNNFDGEWIGAVKIGGDLFEYPTAAAGYEKEESGIVPTFHVADVIPLELTPAFSGQAFNEHFRVWVDFDGNGQFADPAERVFASNPANDSTVVGTFTCPPTVVEGITRMRVSMKYLGSGGGVNGQPPKPCDAAFNYGQVRDFCVHFTTTISTNEASEVGKILVQPNPTDGFFTAKIELEKAADTRLELFSATGQLVDYQQVTSSEGRFSERKFDLAGFGSGLFLLKISTEKGSTVRRVVRF